MINQKELAEAIAVNEARIDDMECNFKMIVAREDHLTLPLYRRLKKLRHEIADFLTRVGRHDNQLPPNQRGSYGQQD